MNEIYEVVRSRVEPANEAAMLELRPAMVAAVRRRFPALLDARLVRMDDGTWLDVVRWSSREAADEAAAEFAEIPEAREMSALVAEVLSFEHGVLAEPAAAERAERSV
jgi:hypothetical protein